MRWCSARNIALVVLIAACRSYAWAPPVEVSGPSSSERSTPRIARGTSGYLHVVYINKASGHWQTLYRSKSPGGVWGAVEQLDTAFSVRCDVAEDSSGRPHVVFAQQNPSAYDLYHAYKSGGVWTKAYIASTAEYEDEPRLVADGTGRIHLVYTKSSNESSSGSIMYRLWNAGSWSAETNLGSTDNTYYGRPDITITPDGNLHVVWGQDSGGVDHIRYRKNAGGVWGASIDTGSGASTGTPHHFFSYPRIAAANSNNIAVVWHDDYSTGASNILWDYSSDGGATWVFPLVGNERSQTLWGGHYPHMDTGNGAAHLINQGANSGNLVYSKWIGGGSWTIAQQTISLSSNWKGWPDITEDASGFLHAVWDEDYGSNTSDHKIMYATTIPDTVPPGPVTSFTATANQGHVLLNWVNPSDVDYNGTVIRFSTSGYPATPTSGTLLVDRATSPGGSDSFDHTGLTNGVQYYYSAFAHDLANLYSSAANATARPSVVMDHDEDGDVDQTDFAAFQNCLNAAATLPSTCFWADFDFDGNVNSADFTLFLNCVSGADIGYVPNCNG